MNNNSSNVIDSIIKLWKTGTYRVYIILAQRDRNRMDDSNVWRIATGVKCPTKCNGSPTPAHARLLGATCTVDDFEQYLLRRIQLGFKIASISAPRFRVQLWVVRPKVTTQLSYQNLRNKFTMKHDFYYIYNKIT